MNDSKSIAKEIVELYNKFGQADYIGEPVSQIEHMSQAAQLAIQAGYDDEIVLAAFFHDIGHICVQAAEEKKMNNFGNKNHEQIGAYFLRAKGFPERLAHLVQNHVEAKRYLTFKFPEYYDALSEASKKTLEFQGGRMNKHEADSFEKDPLFMESILLRKWDEAAKEMQVPIIDMTLIEAKIISVLDKQTDQIVTSR
jgi:phosphonate degradation associated HDIG domain protein